MQLRDIDPGLIELFVDGKEGGLPDAGRLEELGLGEGSVLFMLHRLGWRWEECGSGMALSGEGLVATVTTRNEFQLVTGGEPMTEGRHYWEVEYTSGNCIFMIGAVRPGLDHNIMQRSNDAYFITGYSGCLWGGGKSNADEQGAFKQGDRAGVLLDLDAGWVRFYRNGKRWGPGYTKGVAGPLVRAAQLYNVRTTLTAQPGAAAPEGAGHADEPWEAPALESESESE